MDKVNMSDFVDEYLTGKKKKKKTKKITESKIDVKEILHEQDKENEEDTEEAGEEASTDDAEDATATASKEKADKREPKGEVVLEVSFMIDAVDQGKIQIGSEEYGTITDLSALLTLYDISSKKLLDPKTTVESFTLTAQETISQTDRNNVAIMSQLNKDETFSINVLVNEIGQTFNELGRAATYFNSQYQTNILDVINKSVRE